MQVYVGTMLIELLILLFVHTLPDVWKTHILSPAYDTQDCECLHKNEVWEIGSSVQMYVGIRSTM